MLDIAIKSTLSLAVLASSLSVPSYDYTVYNTPQAQQTRITQEMRDMSTTTIKALVGEILGEDMIPVIACESGFRQYDNNGVVVRSHTYDIGIAQIHLNVWEDKARELGYDVYTPMGNLYMAKHILEVQGKEAWVCYKKLSRET